jgi:hypothetical protein
VRSQNRFNPSWIELLNQSLTYVHSTDWELCLDCQWSLDEESNAFSFNNVRRCSRDNLLATHALNGCGAKSRGIAFMLPLRVSRHPAVNALLERRLVD